MTHHSPPELGDERAKTMRDRRNLAAYFQGRRGSVPEWLTKLIQEQQ
jgi:hypothetical protein